MTTFRQLTRVLQRLFGRRRRADRRLARNVSRPAVEWLEDRSLLAAVTVDPQLFEGSYHVTGHPTLHTGDYTYDLSPGTYLLGISGPGSFTFSVDGSGNVSTSSAAASAVGSTLRLNNSTVQIDPQAFAGQYSIGYGVAPLGTGIRDIVVVPGLSGVYGLAIAGPGSFSFSVDASGDVSGSTSAADFFANNITLRNSTVHIDPQAFAGQYSVGYGVAPVGTGIRDIVVVPGLSGVYGLAIAGLGSFSFSVDSTGNVSGSTPAANFSGMSITFYNSTVHVDPQDYTGRYTVDYVGASLGAGERDFVVVPAVVAYYRLNLNGTGDILFAVDADGNVSTASASAYADGSGLVLNNAIIHVNPQAYLGRYGVSGAGGIQSSGPRDFVVVPALTYTVQLNYPAPGSFTFDVDALGAVSTTSTAAHGTVDTLVFNNTILRVDPDGYSGTYSIQQLQSAVPSLSGIRDFVLLPGISVYKVGSGGVGNFYSQFGLDATGHPTPTTIPVTTGGHTYVFSLAYIAPNSPPLANPDNGAVSEDSTGNVIDVLANDTDADNLPPTPANAGLTVTAVGAANHGTVSLVGGIVTYTPVANYYGSDNFNYTISDSTGLTSTANVSLTVTNVQDAPVAANDAATVSEDSTGNVIDVLANDTDADNLPPTPANAGLTVTAVGAANHGTVSLVGGVVTYTPGIGCGDASDSFTYTVRDASGLTSTAVVSISIIQYVGVSRADGILRVGGGAGVDVVTVSGGNLIVNGVLHSLTGVDEVRVWGRGGNDQIDLSGLAIKTFVDGGDEDDTLTGGSAEDLILGGGGDDTITGAAGNDLLVSGTGRDRIVGSAGNDILVAGDVDCGLSIPALRAISQAWASSQPVDNNSVDDFIDEAVGDADGDKLTGSSGADLFIIGSEDTITDFQFGTPKTNKDGDVVIRDGNVAA